MTAGLAFAVVLMAWASTGSPREPEDLAGPATTATADTEPEVPSDAEPHSRPDIPSRSSEVMSDAAAGAQGFEFGLLGGATLRRRSTGDGIEMAMGLGVLAGLDLHLSRALGGRLELQVSSDAFGGAEGVRAVRVDNKAATACLLAGLTAVVWRAHGVPVGMELLAGAGLRLTLVFIEVAGARDVARDAALLFAAVGGVHVDLSRWRVGVRVGTELPQSRILNAVLVASYRF